MPFGKYEGEPLEAVPTEYLLWLRTIDLRPPLRDAVEGELCGRVPSTPPRPDALELAAAVRTWHRALVVKYHPDRGGSHEAMIAVNDAYELLNAILRERGLTCDA